MVNLFLVVAAVILAVAVVAALRLKPKDRKHGGRPTSIPKPVYTSFIGPQSTKD